MNLIYKSRVALINIGKVLPFIVCAIVFVGYAETTFSLVTNDYIVWDGNIIPNTPITRFIGLYFEYDIIMLVILLTISVAIETCYWNKLAIVYLCFQLYEKNYFQSMELYTETIYIIAVANIIVSWFFVYKGAKMLIKYK